MGKTEHKTWVGSYNETTMQNRHVQDPTPILFGETQTQSFFLLMIWKTPCLRRAHRGSSQTIRPLPRTLPSALASHPAFTDGKILPLTAHAPAPFA